MKHVYLTSVLERMYKNRKQIEQPGTILLVSEEDFEKIKRLDGGRAPTEAEIALWEKTAAGKADSVEKSTGDDQQQTNADAKTAPKADTKANQKADAKADRKTDDI